MRASPKPPVIKSHIILPSLTMLTHNKTQYLLNLLLVAASFATEIYNPHLDLSCPEGVDCSHIFGIFLIAFEGRPGTLFFLVITLIAALCTHHHAINKKTECSRIALSCYLLICLGLYLRCWIDSLVFFT